MDVRLLEPGYLFLLCILPLVWFVPRRLRDVRLGLLRTLVLVAVILGLARPAVLDADDDRYHVLVLDASASVAPAEVERALEFAGSFSAGVEGSRTALVMLGDPAVEEAGFDAVFRLSQGESSLSAAMAAAERWIPSGAAGAITVCSDGQATDRRWGPVTQTLTARGIPVHVARLARAADVYPARLWSPEDLVVGQVARVHCDVVGGLAGGTATLSNAEGELARIEGIDLPASDGGELVFEFEPGRAGFLPLTVALDAPGDPRPANNELATVVAVQEPLRVLYLGQRVQGGADRLEDLLGQGFRVDSARSPDVGLDPFDLVFVDDRPASALPAAVQTEIVEAVRDRGLGLVVAGGKAAFGPGGYHGSVLANALPTEAVQKEEKRDPSTTLVLIIDTSGSMGGMRVTLAKEVARLAMRRLLPHDRVGIVEFYGAKRWAAPIQPASNLIELQRALNRLDSGGGTVILPAIEEAFYGLQNVETRYKHVLILTDGGVETGAFEPLLRKMASKGVNVSTVLVGGDAHSEFLVTLSNWGKGRFYSVPNRFNLPEIILKQPATAQLPAYRPGVHPVQARGGAGWWGDTDPEVVPPLTGYVETKQRPGSQVLLETQKGTHPVLASWRHGLGRATTLATEPTGPGTRSWLDWQDYGAWLGRVVSRTARSGHPEFSFDVRRDRDTLIVSAARRRPKSTVQPRAELLPLESGADNQVFEFRERAPGYFEARMDCLPEREARILAGAVGNLRNQRLASSRRADVAPETQVDPRQGLGLDALAAVTGGAVLPDATVPEVGLETGAGGEARALHTLWPWCFLAALLVFLSELLYRRWPARRGPAPS